MHVALNTNKGVPVWEKTHIYIRDIFDHHGVGTLWCLRNLFKDVNEGALVKQVHIKLFVGTFHHTPFNIWRSLMQTLESKNLRVQYFKQMLTIFHLPNECIFIDTHEALASL